MSNVFEDIGHGVEVAAKDTAHFVEAAAKDVVTVGETVIHLIEDAKALSPAFKSELATLLNDCKPIAITLTPIITAGGENVVADITAIQPIITDVVKLAQDFISFIPTIQAALTKLETDAK